MCPNTNVPVYADLEGKKDGPRDGIEQEHGPHYR